VVDGSDLLGARPSDFNSEVSLVRLPSRGESLLLTVGEVLFASVQGGPDPVEGVALAATVAVDVGLDPSSHVVHCFVPELDDWGHLPLAGEEGVQDCDGVFKFIVDSIFVSVERVQRRDLDTGCEAFATCLQPVLVGLAGASGH